MIRKMYRVVKKAARSIFTSVSKAKQSVVSLPGAFTVAKEASYCPELKRKGYPQRLAENVLWALKYHEANRFYNLYEMDVAGRKCLTDKEFIAYETFRVDRNEANRLMVPGASYEILLRDKHLMGIMLGHYHLATVPNIAMITGGVCYDENGCETTLDSVLEAGGLDVFLKRVDGECADGVYHITAKEQLKTIDLSVGKYVVQKRLLQHEGMNKLWAGAINTCRIVTLFKNGQVELLSAVLRVGTSKSGHVDNWAKGGISVGVHPDGTLVEYGVCKPGYGGKVYAHPDTGVKFGDFRIPEYDKAVELCVKAHQVLRDIPAIGWDVAITPEGPVMIEGNDNWEISLMQASNTGLRKQWEAFMR